MTSEERQLRNALYLVRVNKKNAKWRMDVADKNHDEVAYAEAEKEFKRAGDLAATLDEKLDAIEFAKRKGGNIGAN